MATEVIERGYCDEDTVVIGSNMEDMVFWGGWGGGVTGNWHPLRE